jgi:hypothetical protein
MYTLVRVFAKTQKILWDWQGSHEKIKLDSGRSA